MQSCLANLEFPPPPTDLPPPPEEFDGSFEEKPSSPPKKVLDDLDASDVSNLEPSVEEASSRFGVSLKKREASTEKELDGDKGPQRLSSSPEKVGGAPEVPAVGCLDGSPVLNQDNVSDQGRRSLGQFP